MIRSIQGLVLEAPPKLLEAARVPPKPPPPVRKAPSPPVPSRPLKPAVRLAWDIKVVLFLSECARYPAAWTVFLANFSKTKYPLLRRLVGTHLLGFVGPKLLRKRTALCNLCPYKFKFKGGDYCKADGCGCGCWQGSRITYKRRLSGFKCPRGKFGYGWLGGLFYKGR